MRVKISLFLGLMLFSGAITAKGDTPECYSFFHPPELLSATELMQIADSCPIKELGELYTHRAEHMQLLDDSQTISTQFQPRSDFDRHLESYRIYIALIENFGIHFKGTLADLIQELNSGYKGSKELAELRFKGYEKRTEWLEWYRAIKKN